MFVSLTLLPITARKRHSSWHVTQLLHAVRNASLAQVVWGHFNLDLVACKNADVVLAHAAGDVGDNDVPVLQLHAKHGVGQGLLNRAFHFDDVVFSHVFRCSRTAGMAA